MNIKETIKTDQIKHTQHKHTVTILELPPLIQPPATPPQQQQQYQQQQQKSPVVPAIATPTPSPSPQPPPSPPIQPPKSPAMELHSTSFCVGELVWGAARGHPAWPGKIVTPPEGVATCSDSTWVQWFGGRPHHIELVSIASLKSLSEGLDAHHKAQKDTRK